MLFPEIRSFLKRFAPDSSEVLSLGLKNISFNTVDIPNARWLFDNGYVGTLAALGAGAPTWSGEPVNLLSALSHPVVFACNRIISEPLGFLPAVMMQNVNGKKIPATQHPMYTALKNAPNEETSAQNFRETLTSQCLLGGNAYAKIDRRSGGTETAIGLRQLQPEQVSPTRDKANRLVYEIKNQDGTVGATYTVVPGKPQDILHLRGIGWDGLRGYSVIQVGRNSIGSALAAEKNLAMFWANGGRVPSHIEWAEWFNNAEDYKKFADDFRALWADGHKLPILDRDKKLVKDGMSMRDSQGIENRQFTVSDICRWFNVSPVLVHDLSRATFANVEQLSLDFYKYTLSPWVGRWESEFWRCVLTPQEQAQGYYLKFNVNALLRGDFKTRIDGFASMLQNGIASINEVRELEDWNPITQGDEHHIQSNMGTLMPDGQLSIPQSPKVPA